MNSTVWVTLTSFIKHLGRTGNAVVDETEKGKRASILNCGSIQIWSDVKKYEQKDILGKIYHSV